jgi:hypothetical protein
MSEGNGAANYIPDGYTQSAYFREVPGIHTDVRVRFRPLLITQQAQIDREIKEADFEKRQWIAARWITQQVVNWDIEKKPGEIVSHSDINEVLRLRPLLFNRIWDAINSQDGGDVDPKASAYENHMRAQREQAVASAGAEKTPQEVLEGN